MAARNTICIYGNAHVSGNVAAGPLLAPGGAGGGDGITLTSSQAWGSLGQATVYLDQLTSTTNGPFPPNSIITGGTSGRKARVIGGDGATSATGKTLIVERLNVLDPIPAIGVGWFTRGETITADNSPAASNIVVYGGEHGMQAAGAGTSFNPTQTILEQLCNPVLNALWPNDASDNIFWDRRSKRGDLLDYTLSNVCTSTTVTITGGNTLTLGAGNWAIQPTAGQIVTISGFPTAGNNGSKTVSASTANTLTIAGMSNESDTDITITQTVPVGYVKIESSAGGFAHLVGTESGDLVLAGRSGTFANGNTLNEAGKAQFGVVGAAAVTARTTGDWVPYSTRPNLGGTGSRWDTPPGGSESSGHKGLLGIEPMLVKEAYNYYSNLGQKLSVLKLDANHADDIQAGGLGGACYGVVKCSGSFPTTWEIDEPAQTSEQLICNAVTNSPNVVVPASPSNRIQLSSGAFAFLPTVGQIIEFSGFTGSAAANNGLFLVAGYTTSLIDLLSVSGGAVNLVASASNASVTITLWKGTLEAWDSANKHLYVTNTQGRLKLNHTVTGVTSGAVATATGNCVGWSKDQTHWVKLIGVDDGFVLGDVGLAATKLTGGDTLSHKLHVIAPWEGDILLPIRQTTGTVVSLGINSTKINTAYGEFMADMRAATGSPDLVFACFQHKVQSHAVSRPNHAVVLRLAYQQISAADPKFRVINADEFEAVSGLYGDVRDEDATHSAVANEVLWLETYAYPIIGRKAWEAFRGATAVPVGQDLDEAPVILITGQSHAASQIFYTYWLSETDPELAKLPETPGLWEQSTIDDAIWNYNAEEGRWDPYNVFNNATTFGNATTGYSSFEASLLLGLKARYGSIYCIKVGYNASSLQRVNFSPAAWETGARTTAAISCTCVGGATGTFTAGTGTPFAVFTAGEYMEVSGALSGLVGFGGNNTPVAPNAAPARIVSIGGGGASIVLEGAFTTDASAKTVTFTQGPMNLREQAGEVIADALTQLVTELKRIPRAIATVTAQGEGDLAATAGYQAAMQSHIEWCREVFGHRIRGEEIAPHVWVMTSDKTPLDQTAGRVNINALRATQQTLGSVVPRYAAVDSKNLPVDHDFSQGGFWPRTYDPDNNTVEGFGVHHTPSGYVRMGWLVDAALGTFAGIPAHQPGVIHFPFDESAGGEGSIPPEVVSPGDAESVGDVDAPPGSADTIVEDGTGLETANSYIGEEDATTYLDTYKNPDAWINAESSARNQALRVATQWLDATFGERWIGIRYSQEQGLDWPRSLAYDMAGKLVEGLPRRLPQATAEMAVRYLEDPTQLAPDVSASDVGSITSQTQTVGPISQSTSYSNTRGNENSFQLVERMLRSGGLITSGQWAAR